MFCLLWLPLMHLGQADELLIPRTDPVSQFAAAETRHLERPQKP